jgi:hypothetical protein
MVSIVKPSAWQFVTSSSGGLGVEFVVVEGGMIYLQDPSGKNVSFLYGAAGAGLSAGFKLPKIGKLQINVKGKAVGGAVAPAAFPNMGKLYVLDTCPTDDLTQDAIRGVCLFAEIGGGLVAGVSGTAMIFGMSPTWLAAIAASGPMAPLTAYFDYKLLQSATGILVMGGLNVGVQAGGGIGGFLGGLW